MELIARVFMKTAMFENVYVQNGTMGMFLSLLSFDFGPTNLTLTFFRRALVVVTSDPSSIPPVTKVLSDMSRGTPENKFPIADETRWLVLTPEEAAVRFDGGHVCAFSFLFLSFKSESVI